MKRTSLILSAVAIGLIALGAFLFFGGHLNPKQGGILIDSTPSATVIIDGAEVGHTPYESTRSPGEISIKLIPESFDKALAPYETKVTVVSGVRTVVRREFGETNEQSFGEIVSFEKIGRSETSLAVISVPDAAQISIDGQVRGFTPYKTTSITPGEHQLNISAPSHDERQLSVRAVAGYKLTLIVKLLPNGQITQASTEQPTPAPTAEPSTTEEKAVMVEILSTPTGFLRVRSQPSTVSSEVGQVKPGERFVLVETDEKTGWFRIQFQKDKEGWVSNQYAKKVDNIASPSPTPR